MQLNNQSCVFLLLLVLSFALSVTDVANEDVNNKTVPIVALVTNSAVLLIILLQMFGVDLTKKIVNSNYIIFFTVYIMSLILSINDCCDKDKDDKAFPIIVLIINVIVGGIMFLNYINNYRNN